MTRRSIPLSASLALIAVLSVAALPVMAKEGAEARLDAPIPIDGPPGSTFQMRWTLVSVGADGSTSPIFGSPVYVRLTPADGGAAIELEAREAPEGSGHYVANITVPDGGIDRLEVAMRGQSCDASGCQRADLTFPFAGYGSAGVAIPPATIRPVGSGTASLAPMVALVTALSVAAGLGALVSDRRATRRRQPDPA